MERLERLPPMPIEEGRCNECGTATPPDLVYCNTECGQRYNNRLAQQGKSVMQLLKVWRKHRGAKGTPGEGKMTDIAARVDIILNNDRRRWCEYEVERRRRV